MLLLAIILIGTFALRILVCWAMVELREAMQRAGRWMGHSSTWAVLALVAWIFLPMIDLGSLRRNPELEPTMWEVVQVVLPLVVTCAALTAVTCAWIHVRQELRQERRCSDE